MNFFKATIKEEKTLKKIIRKIEKRHHFICWIILNFWEFAIEF